MRFAAALSKALDEHPKIKSLRQLALEIDQMDVTELQKIGRAEREASLSKIIDISRGLGISFGTLAKFYDELTEEDLRKFSLKLEKNKKK